nr:MAG TPA: hypothetical protein [Caudoviricetes sp.]
MINCDLPNGVGFCDCSGIKINAPKVVQNPS